VLEGIDVKKRSRKNTKRGQNKKTFKNVEYKKNVSPNLFNLLPNAVPIVGAVLAENRDRV